MDKQEILDKKIAALQNAVLALKQNRDELAKELELVKAGVQRKQSA